MFRFFRHLIFTRSHRYRSMAIASPDGSTTIELPYRDAGVEQETSTRSQLLTPEAPTFSDVGVWQAYVDSQILSSSSLEGR